MNELKITATDEVIEVESWSLSTDKDQFAWTFNAEVATKEDLYKLVPAANLGQNFISVTFTAGSETWQLIMEEPDSKDTSFSYTITGKSKSIILAEPYAKLLTKIWLNTTAQAICAELCAAAGITLVWEIIDWSIPYYMADQRYPIDIIMELSSEIGAKRHSLPDGTLVIYPVSNPQDLATATPLYQIDTARNVFERAEKFINRENFNCIFVTKDATLLDAPSISLTEMADGDDRILHVYTNPAVPYDVVNLHHASGGGASLTYEGTYTERQTDDVIIDAGEGRLSKNFQSLITVKWQQTEVGALTIAENGKIFCDKGDTGLATVTYTTQYLKYRLRRIGNIEKTLLMSDELARPVLTTGTNPAPPIVVKTLSSSEALTARANAEIWSYYDTKEYFLTVTYEGIAFLCGKVARVNIIREQIGFNVWVKAVAINSTGDEIVQAVTVEKMETING